MNSRDGVNKSRRCQVRLPVSLAAEVETFAVANGLRLGTAVRVLVRQRLASGQDSAECRDCRAAFASLVAAEHSLLVVASILPQGRSLIAGLASEAAAAAEQRLALFEQTDPDEETRP